MYSFEADFTYFKLAAEPYDEWAGCDDSDPVQVTTSDTYVAADITLWKI